MGKKGVIIGRSFWIPLNILQKSTAGMVCSDLPESYGISSISTNKERRLNFIPFKLGAIS